MKKVFVPAVLLMLVLTGCASKNHHNAPAVQTPAPAGTAVSAVPDRNTTNIDGSKEVFYLCGTGAAKTHLSAMYGLQGQNVVAAQVKYQDQLSPVMMRDPRDVNYNTFVSPEGITWRTAIATSDTVDKVSALGLLQPVKRVVNGVEKIDPQIVTQNCVVDNTVAVAAPANTKTVKTTKTVTTKKVYKNKK